MVSGKGWGVDCVHPLAAAHPPPPHHPHPRIMQIQLSKYKVVSVNCETCNENQKYLEKQSQGNEFMRPVWALLLRAWSPPPTLPHTHTKIGLLWSDMAVAHSILSTGLTHGFQREDDIVFGVPRSDSTSMLCVM